MLAFINGGSAKLTYEAPDGPNDCWPSDEVTLKAFITFDDSRLAATTRGVAYEITIKPRKSDCDE